MLRRSLGVRAEVIKPDSVTRLPEELFSSARRTGRFLMAEEALRHRGIYDEIAADPRLFGVRCDCVDLGDAFVPHGSNAELWALHGLTARDLAQRALALLDLPTGESDPPQS